MGSMRVYMDLNGIYMGLYGCIWVYMDLYGIYMGLYGFIWDLYGFIWVYMDLCYLPNVPLRRRRHRFRYRAGHNLIIKIPKLPSSEGKPVTADGRLPNEMAKVILY